MNNHLGRRHFLQLAAGAASVSLANQRLFGANGDAEVVVETTSGKLRGKSVEGIKTFLGVPYGTPTFGHRFQRASLPQPWTGVRDALEYGNRSPFVSADTLTARLIDWNNAPGKESDDCLVLNIFTPGVKDNRKRPVMFWLHGGGFTTGTGSYAATNGSHLAKRGDVVVVTINHRIGFLGYNYLAQIGGADYADSGNIGQLDAILALQWVRDNIANFGGDPGNVMIFGESGGGAKVSVLMAMPEAKGLFHRACIESGPSIRMLLPDVANRSAETFVKELGLTKDNFADIQKLPMERLKAAQAAHPALAWSPVVDGRSLPRHPFDPDGPEVSADVPLLIGCNKTEATFFQINDLDKIYALDEAGVRARLAAVAAGPRATGAPSDPDKLIATYKTLYPTVTPGELYIHIASDSTMWFGSVTLAERKAAQHRAPVFMYVFGYETDALNGKLHSPHGIEIPFVFENAHDGTGFVGTNPARLELAPKVSNAWATFARTGSPKTKDFPDWKPYTAESRTTEVIGLKSQAMDDPWKEARLLFTADRDARKG
jgi:para-nitrobenzyl esterase